MRIKIDPNEVYTCVTLGKTLGVSRQMVLKMVNKGQLPPTKIGRRYVWTGTVVLRYLSKIGRFK